METASRDRDRASGALPGRWPEYLGTTWPILNQVLRMGPWGTGLLARMKGRPSRAGLSRVDAAPSFRIVATHTRRHQQRRTAAHQRSSITKKSLPQNAGRRQLTQRAKTMIGRTRNRDEPHASTSPTPATTGHNSTLAGNTTALASL